MKDINEVFLTGRLTRNPEKRIIKSSQGDVTVVQFTLAINRRANPQTGESRADFIIFRGYGPTAEAILKYAAAPMELVVKGEIRSDQYEKDGKKQYFTYVLVNEFRLPPKNSGQRPETQDERTGNTQPPANSPAAPEGQQNAATRQPQHNGSGSSVRPAGYNMYGRNVAPQNEQAVRGGQTRPASTQNTNNAVQGRNVPQSGPAPTNSGRRPQGYHPNAGNTAQGQTTAPIPATAQQGVDTSPSHDSTTGERQVAHTSQPSASQTAQRTQPYQQQAAPEQDPQAQGVPNPFFGSVPKQFNGFEDILDEEEDDLPFH